MLVQSLLFTATPKPDLLSFHILEGSLVSRCYSLSSLLDLNVGFMHACGGQCIYCLNFVLSFKLHSQTRFLSTVIYMKGYLHQDALVYFDYLKINVKPESTNGNDLPTFCTSIICLPGGGLLALCLVLSLDN